MNNKKYLDISLLKNQNIIALKFSELFSVEELETFDFNNSEISSKRDVSQPVKVVFTKEFDDRSVQVIDTMLLDIFPSVRYIDIRFAQGDYFQLDFRCKYSKKIINHLMIIIARAINFSMHKSKQDKFIVKGNIINNFSKQLAKEVKSLDTLRELKFISEYISNNNSILIDNNFKFNFEVDGIKFKVITDANTIRFEFNKEDSIHYIYFVKNKIGVSSISLIIEKAFRIRSKIENKPDRT